MATTTNNECVICASPFNKSNRVKLACLYCGYEACRACNETYILSETIPKCMNVACGREWTRKYLNTSFTKTFLAGAYKKHREDVLFDRERSLMPETQIYVQYINEIAALEAEHKRTEAELAEIYARRSAISSNIWRIQQILNGRSSVANGETLRFVRKCPDGECRGFLSTQWKCGVCEKWTCNRCHEIKGDERDVEHVCDPDKVATAELLMRDTKNCPSCHTSIHKIDGCDQMWCTQCHTAFSWRTGRIVENGIHNPHYYEWLRRNGGGGVAAAVGAGGMCGRDNYVDLFLRANNMGDINRRAYRLLSDENPMHSISFYAIVRNITHMREVDMARYQDIVNGNALNNRHLRVDYMMNKIGEEQFKRAIQQLEKKTEKAREYANVLEILVNTTNDVLARFCELAYRKTNAFRYMDALEDTDISILDEIPLIVKYVNECLEEISKTYSSVRYMVSHRLLIVKYDT